MIQTNIFVIYERGLNFDIEPKEMTRPKGSANTSVSAKIRQVCSNPSKRVVVTVRKSIPDYSFVIR